MSVDDISPARLLRSLWGGWYWIVVGGVLGGLIGWTTTFARAPRYEASAELSIGFDYARVNEMDDTVTSYVDLRVRDLLLSDETLTGALDALSVSGEMDHPPADLQELRGHIQLVEDGSRWSFISRADTPADAAAIANAWADSSLQALEQAMIHAIRAAELQTAVYRAGCKLELDPASPGQAIWHCERPNASARPSNLPQALMNEANLSKGLLPSMSFSLLQRAKPPSTPVVWGRGGLMLAGTLLGLVISVLAIISRANGGVSLADPAQSPGRVKS
jgi:hypothetical protein